MEEIARSARLGGARVYLVGGAVRDLLLGLPSGEDFDLVVEGDAVRVAETLAASWEVPLTRSVFRTARLSRAGAAFDLVTARRERYARPGALPEIEPASIESDLERRDFSIHALGFEIPPEASSLLLDPCRGFEDVARRRLRVLHEHSFCDDPTRILRAVRFELRLGFAMDEGTERLAREAVAAGALGEISSDRLRQECALALAQIADLGPLLRRWEEIGVWRFLTGGGLPSRHQVGRLAAWRAGGERDPQAVWVALGCVLEADATRRLLERLRLPSRRAAEVLGAGDQLRSLEEILLQGNPLSEMASAWLGASLVVREFASGSPDPAVRSAAARAAGAARVELGINGDLLQAHGAVAGPPLGAALRATLAARRDGRVRADEELEYALAWLEENRTR